jgi:tight adherence protein C
MFTDFSINLAGQEILILALVFLAVVVGVVGATFMFRRDPVSRRYAVGAGQNASGGAQSIRYDNPITRISPALLKFQAAFKPRDERATSEMRMRLVQAGFYNPRGVETYYVSRIVLSLGLGVAALILAPLVPNKDAAINIVPFLALLGAGFGFVLPMLVVNRRVSSRQLAVQESFPDALDMLLVCVEAGLGLSAAIERVASELDKAHPVLSEHFKLFGLEMRAGANREDALRNFGDRVGIADVQSFVTLLVQSQELGTSLAESLRVHAYEMRQKRMLRAEEKANKLPAKLVLPLGFFVFPCMLMVTGTPLAIRVIRDIIPALGAN